MRSRSFHGSEPRRFCGDLTLSSHAMNGDKHPSQRRRRTATPGFRQLPAKLGKHKRPHWPEETMGPATKQEIVKWRKLWKLPQSIIWRELSLDDDVAVYVRMWCRAVGPKPAAWLYSELRQLDAKLGISPRAMRNLRWEISPLEKKEYTEETPPDVVRELRSRVKAVD